MTRWKPSNFRLVAPRACAGAATEINGTNAIAPTAEKITNIANIVVAFILYALAMYKDLSIKRCLSFC